MDTYVFLIETYVPSNIPSVVRKAFSTKDKAIDWLTMNNFKENNCNYKREGSVIRARILQVVFV